MKKESLQRLTRLALLIAMEIILSRFCSLSAWNIKIGFSFLPVAVAAVLYGPLAAGIVGGLGDFIGAILFPIGAYFPGFTLTAFLTGIVLGLCLHKSQSVRRVLGAVAINQLFLSLLLNTLWISILYGSPYGALLLTRIVQCTVLGPVQFLTIGLMTKTLVHYTRSRITV